MLYKKVHVFHRKSALPKLLPQPESNSFSTRSSKIHIRTAYKRAADFFFVEIGLDSYHTLSWLMAFAAETNLAQPQNAHLLLPWNAPLVCKA